jgi:hypothetical protein
MKIEINMREMLAWKLLEKSLEVFKGKLGVSGSI